jgi:protein TonB
MSRRRKILLIDYDPESIESTRDPLVRAGYEVEVANDGIAGVEAFQRLKPDLVLIEPMVPKKHGFQVCKEIKSTAEGRDTPVLITTGFYRGRKHRDEALESFGCDDYLEKPIAEELLLSTCGKFFLDTQEPPISVADESPPPLSLAPAEPTDPVADSALHLVDRLPEMLIPEERAPSRFPALDDLTEDEIQERLDAMIIGVDDPPLTAPPMVDPPQPAVAELHAAPDEMQIPRFEVAVTPPVQEQPAASPSVPGPTARAPGATVESMLARQSTRRDLSRIASESVAAAEPEVAPFMVDEMPARSRLPLWIGIAAGVFIVVGMTILWMLRDPGAGDPSVEVAAMSIGEATPAPSRAPASSSPIVFPSEPAPGPDAAIVFGAAAETVADLTSSPENPQAAPSGEIDPANDSAPRNRTPAAVATTTAVAAEPASKTPQVDHAIDDVAPAPMKPRPEPVREAVTPIDVALGASPPVPAEILLAPVPVVIPETETASAPPAEPPAPETRRGDLVDLAELDRTPVAKIRPMPEYPAAAQSMRLEGTVNLRLLLDERGQVEQVEIDSGTKSKQLQRAAVAAVERWVYEPGIKDGVPVKVWITSSVNFKL